MEFDLEEMLERNEQHLIKLLEIGEFHSSWKSSVRKTKDNISILKMKLRKEKIKKIKKIIKIR